MANVDSPRAPLTVQLPGELIEELQQLAREKHKSVDELVMEACLAYTEPYLWESAYKEWRRANPENLRQEFGIDGDDLHQKDVGEGQR